MKIVQKYGGSSLADETCVRRVAKRIAADAAGNRMLVVVSAQGKTTDCLTAQYNALSSRFPSRESDRLLATGEQASAALLAAALNEVGVPAISLDSTDLPIRASGTYGNGKIKKIITRRVYKEWRQGRVVILTGFQGVTRNGDYITLGRGGSDTSAVALAVALRADRCMIFTDVDGVYSADPRKIPFAQQFESIHVDSMLLLAEQGAKVLHPKSVELAKRKHLPITVLTSFSHTEGTEVSDTATRRTGVTFGVLDEIPTVSVVFSDFPKEEILIQLRNLCKKYGINSSFDGFLFELFVPHLPSDEILAEVHCILYP